MNTNYPSPSINDRIALLARDLHTYANYSQLEHAAADAGCCMKESKDFYGYRILTTLEKHLHGKEKDEILMLLSNWHEIL